MSAIGSSDVVLYVRRWRPEALHCLETLRQNTPSHRIVVVDDATGTGAPHSAALAGLEVLDGKGSGRVAGYNLGLKSSTSEAVCLVSAEAVVSRGWLDQLERALAVDQAVAAVGPLLPGVPGQTVASTYGDLDDFARFAAAYNHSDPGKWSAALRLSASCMLLRRSATDEVGGFDESFTVGELADDDLSLRLLMAGYRLLRCGDVLVHHLETPSLPQEAARSAEIERQSFRARWGFAPGEILLPEPDVVAALSGRGPLRVLDLACGCGATLLEVANRFPGSELQGVETNAAASAVASKVAGVPVAGELAEGLRRQPEASLDAVLCAGVLERQQDPWQLLAAVRSRLKPDGVVVAIVPNVMHVSVVLPLLRGRFAYGDSGVLDKRHLRFFTLAETEGLFAAAGFSSRGYGSLAGKASEEDEKLAGALAATFSLDRAQYLSERYLVVARP